MSPYFPLFPDGGANAGTGQGPQTVYSYSIPSYGSQPPGYDADGNVVGYTDSVMGGWGFNYDPLNRVTSGSASSGAYTGLQTGWGYDPFGNRTSESFSGSTQMPMPTSSTASYNANNQIQGASLMLGAPVQYDASGDVTEDNQNQYLYDGEGRVCAVKNMTVGSMTGYIYGADGTRVSMGTISTWGSCDPVTNGYQATKDSILGPTGGQLTETSMDANGNMAWAHTNVWAGGELIATYDPNGLHFYLNDWTGSRRVQTDYQGLVEQTCANLPYGNGETCGASPDEDLFAGLGRDSESGLDHAMYRQYSSNFGLWTTPDPYDGSYDWTNPQSLNRYAYVNGMPLGAIDPSGLDGVPVFELYGWYSPASVFPAWLTGAVPYFDIGFGVFELGKLAGWWGHPAPFNGTTQPRPSATNNVSKNPCAYMGKAMPPSAYAAQGAASNIYKNPISFAADTASKGWTGFLNSQPLNSGTVQQNAAYGNYVFGVYMQAAGLTLSQALSGANAFAAYRHIENPGQYAGQQMDPNYPSLPVQNVTNVTNGFNAEANGTTCHN